MPVPQGKPGVEKVMGEYGAGTLHSGSKDGPKVTDRKQAVAIALHSAGLSNKYSRSDNPLLDMAAFHASVKAAHGK